MSGTKIPIVILAGSDRRPGDLPSTVRDKHPLSGYKAVDVHIGGRTLIEVLIERLERCDRFHPIYVAGPAALLGPALGQGKLIDCDGTFGENLQVSIETVHAEHPDRPMAFITCDVLPEVETLSTLLEDYDSETPCDMWFPMIYAPEDRGSLGESAWKPAYHIVPNEGQPAVGILPGHLVLADPAALRLKFMYRLAQLAYRTRNRPIDYRRGVMVRGVVLELLYQDLWHLLTLRAPTLTWTVLSVGISAARELREGRITRARLAYALRQILVTSRHRRRHPERRVRLPIVEGLSLALDIDTEEEARAAGGNFATHSR